MPDLKPFETNSAEHLRLVLETGHIGIWELDLRSGLAWRNKTHDEIFGYQEALDQWTYENFLDHIIEADRERVDKLQKSAIEQRREWVFECRILRKDGEERWISAAGRLLVGPDGEPFKLIGHVIDITDTKNREARLQLLTEELDHRVRNMLAMIRSMVRLSAAKADDIPSFAQALEGRVGALARSQELFLFDSGKTLAPSGILETELSAFPDARERFAIKVDDEPQLTGAAAQGLALVFHELITNAIKYGALSNQDGSLEVGICGSKDSCRITWKERGGPQLKQERQPGFGTRLISGAIGSHGKVNLEYPPDGLECVIDLKVDGDCPQPAV